MFYYMSKKEIFEKAYNQPRAIWTRPEPPEEIIELVENGNIKPCKAIDIGCGEGYYSIYLASKGFQVTGIDISEKAIQYAKENAAKKGVNVKFIARDIADLGNLKEKFDFVLEWGIMHIIMPPKRKEYVEKISNILNDGGKYLSTCFNEQSPESGGAGKKQRIGARSGNKLYYSSQDELKELFKPYFRIIETKIIQMRGGKGQSHISNYFFMEKTL